jgi:CUB/sushi domain-containing protein
MYSCDINHQLSGSSVRECQEDGTWSESEPTCEGMWDDNQSHVKYTSYHPLAVIVCPALTSPDNGNVNQLGNTPGGLALYACNDNFELSGDMSRQCGPNGQWTGEAPLCERKEVMPACCNIP